MFELWIPLKDIPAEGREFHLTDQSLWTGPMREYGLGVKPGRPFEASLSVTPEGRGCLVSGTFSGSVLLPCDACAEDVELPVAASFESFEEPPADADEALDESRVANRSGSLELDAAGLLWEQFLLALPERALCRPDCKGLCPKCGVNRNQGICSCEDDSGDPRLAVLRTLKLS